MQLGSKSGSFGQRILSRLPDITPLFGHRIQKAILRIQADAVHHDDRSTSTNMTARLTIGQPETAATATATLLGNLAGSSAVLHECRHPQAPSESSRTQAHIHHPSIIEQQRK